MPEISESELKAYIADRAEKERLAKENEKMLETAENTKVALKANREEIKTLKEEKTQAEERAIAAEKAKEEELKKFEWFDQLKEKAEKFDAKLAEETTARETRITEMKEKLWKEFLEKNSYLLDDMAPEKVEKFLQSNIEAVSSDWKPPVQTWAPSGWMNPNWAQWGKATPFDEAIQKWDAMAALSHIPNPS